MARKTSGSSCVRTGFPTASSKATTTSSITAATPGTLSSISPGKSCPSRYVIGLSSVTQSEGWYKATSRAKGSHRNLGGLASGRPTLRERDGPHREGEEPKPMMHGHEKSDLVIVAMKPANKAEGSPLRRRLRGRTQRSRWSEGRGPRGMRTSKARTGLRARQACQRRWSVYGKTGRHTPEAGAVCGKAARTDLGGGRAMKRTSLPLRDAICCGA